MQGRLSGLQQQGKSESCFLLFKENKILFDLVVFCVGQEAHTKLIPDNSNIYIDVEERYFDYWKFLTREKGCWYNL